MLNNSCAGMRNWHSIIIEQTNRTILIAYHIMATPYREYTSCGKIFGIEYIRYY